MMSTFTISIGKEVSARLVFYHVLSHFICRAYIGRKTAGSSAFPLFMKVACE
jgi:uncharacterized membrane protein YhdT